MTRHLEYAVDLVGIEHVGVSTDFSFDAADFNDELQRNPTCSMTAIPAGARSNGCPRKAFCHSANTSGVGDGTAATSKPCSAGTSIGWPSEPGAPE
jgi:microsomal dipeptidase-like Zn-dependent dipeptidase